MDARSDDDLLAASRVEPEAFAAFYRRHVTPLLAYFVRRTRDAELAADLTAETFAAALAGRRRFRPDAGTAGAWLYGIAMKKLADAQRRGYVERRAQKRMGMERIELTDEDVARIERLGADETATLLVAGLPADQREAIVAHVVDERGYGEIASELRTSEAVVRKRVSRGLRTVRQRMGGRA